MNISIIAAVAKNRAIGINNKLLWHLPDDMKHFKDTTLGYPIIMGRKTYESIGHSLPGRKNIIVTKKKNYQAKDCIVVHSFEDSLKCSDSTKEVFVIGGGEIYKQALSYANKLYLTIVDDKPKADTFFPKINKSKWSLVESEFHNKDKRHKYSFTYKVYKIKNKTLQKTVDIRYAKSKGYKKILSEIEKEGVCPFCPEYFKWHRKPILKQVGGWIITKNFKPYKNAKYHFLIINSVHKEQFKELSPNDWRAINALVNWVIKKYKIKGGALALRFGDTTYTGATVCHLHAHLIVPEVKSGKSIAVQFPVG